MCTLASVGEVRVAMIAVPAATGVTVSVVAVRAAYVVSAGAVTAVAYGAA